MGEVYGLTRSGGDGMKNPRRPAEPRTFKSPFAAANPCLVPPAARHDRTPPAAEVKGLREGDAPWRGPEEAEPLRQPDPLGGKPNAVGPRTPPGGSPRRARGRTLGHERAD